MSPNFGGFGEKFWMVELADYSQKHPVTNNPGIDDLPACYWFFENWNIICMPFIYTILSTQKDPLQVGYWIFKF